MTCAFCDREQSCPFTVRAPLGDGDVTVNVRFCSRECLAAWAAPDVDYGRFAANGEVVDGADPPGRDTWATSSPRTGTAQD